MEIDDFIHGTCISLPKLNTYANAYGMIVQIMVKSDSPKNQESFCYMILVHNSNMEQITKIVMRVEGWMRQLWIYYTSEMMNIGQVLYGRATGWSWFWVKWRYGCLGCRRVTFGLPCHLMWALCMYVCVRISEPFWEVDIYFILFLFAFKQNTS